MGLPELFGWMDANGTAPSSRGLTLAEAEAMRDDAAIAEILSTVVPGLAVRRGIITTVEFNAGFTVAMDAALTNNERRTLTTWLAAGEIDVDGLAIAPVLDKIGYPRTRDGSPAEAYLGRRTVTYHELPALLTDRRGAPPERRERIETEPDGTLTRVVEEDGTERTREPVLNPDGTRARTGG